MWYRALLAGLLVGFGLLRICLRLLVTSVFVTCSGPVQLTALRSMPTVLWDDISLCLDDAVGHVLLFVVL